MEDCPLDRKQADIRHGYDLTAMFGEGSEGFGDGSLAIWVVMGMALGTGLGSALGVALDNIALGIAMGSSVGMGLGAAFGVAFGAKFDDE